MKITRIIDGKPVEITLTEEERTAIYLEESKAEDVRFLTSVSEDLTSFTFDADIIKAARSPYLWAMYGSRKVREGHYEAAVYALKKALEKKNAVC